MDNWDVESSGKNLRKVFFLQIGLRFEGFPVGCFFGGELLVVLFF